MLEGHLTLTDAANALCIRLSAVQATGDWEEFRSVLELMKTLPVDPSAIYEILLQSHLFLGYPKAIEGLRRLRDTFPDFLPPAARPIGARESAEYDKRGRKLCGQVYGINYMKLRRAMGGISPDLDYWMVWEGYGKVLSRTGVSGATRELCTCAALVVTGDSVQLHSHMRGALNLGASHGQLAAAVEIAAAYVDERRKRAAFDLLERISNATDK